MSGLDTGFYSGVGLIFIIDTLLGPGWALLAIFAFSTLGIGFLWIGAKKRRDQNGAREKRLIDAQKGFFRYGLATEGADLPLWR